MSGKSSTTDDDEEERETPQGKGRSGDMSNKTSGQDWKSGSTVEIIRMKTRKILIMTEGEDEGNGRSKSKTHATHHAGSMGKDHGDRRHK